MLSYKNSEWNIGESLLLWVFLGFFFSEKNEMQSLEFSISHQVFHAYTLFQICKQQPIFPKNKHK